MDTSSTLLLGPLVASHITCQPPANCDLQTLSARHPKQAGEIMFWTSLDMTTNRMNPA